VVLVFVIGVVDVGVEVDTGVVVCLEHDASRRPPTTRQIVRNKMGFFILLTSIRVFYIPFASIRLFYISFTSIKVCLIFFQYWLN
jgi:hypothetical protein